MKLKLTTRPHTTMLATPPAARPYALPISLETTYTLQLQSFDFGSGQGKGEGKGKARMAPPKN